MSESEQPGPQESAGGDHMTEKPAGLRAAQPPTRSDVEAAKQVDQDNPNTGQGREGQTEAEATINREAGDAADASTNPPEAAQPGAKDSPDMKDMAVGPRPVDDQSRQ
jgi:hypothetical protein